MNINFLSSNRGNNEANLWILFIKNFCIKPVRNSGIKKSLVILFVKNLRIWSVRN